MHRIDTPSALNSKFTSGDPAKAIPPTEVSADWLNAVQEELANAITISQVDLDKGKNNQLATILQVLGAGKKQTGNPASKMFIFENQLAGAQLKISHGIGIKNVAVTIVAAEKDPVRAPQNLITQADLESFVFGVPPELAGIRFILIAYAPQAYLNGEIQGLHARSIGYAKSGQETNLQTTLDELWRLLIALRAGRNSLYQGELKIIECNKTNLIPTKFAEIKIPREPGTYMLTLDTNIYIQGADLENGRYFETIIAQNIGDKALGRIQRHNINSPVSFSNASSSIPVIVDADGSITVNPFSPRKAKGQEDISLFHYHNINLPNNLTISYTAKIEKCQPLN